MLEIRNAVVYDLKESIIAARNAMRTDIPEYTDEEFEKGLATCKRLTRTGLKTGVSCHSNYLTGIRVSFDLIYPQYISPELQRYHFIDIVTSSSKMHRLAKMKLSECTNKYVDPEIINIEQKFIDAYNICLKNEPQVSGEEWDEWEKTRYGLFMQMISNCPLGLELFMRISTNYKQLQTIYFQRRHHKLKEDWGTFCRFIESLPYSELIIGEDEPTDSEG